MGLKIHLSREAGGASGEDDELAYTKVMKLNCTQIKALIKKNKSLKNANLGKVTLVTLESYRNWIWKNVSEEAEDDT